MWTYAVIAILVFLLYFASRKIYAGKKKGSCYGCGGCGGVKDCGKNES